MNVPTKRQGLLCTGLALALFLSACDSRASRAQAALGQYEAATAAGDLPAARTALLALVDADEDVASYWVELGKLQITLKDIGASYYAFTRANELDRGNPEVLRYLTQLAIQGGDLETAEQRAHELDLVSPGNPVAKITTGLIALRRSQFDDGLRLADEILAVAPLDPNGKILKAKALVGLGRHDEAIQLLEQQAALQPKDSYALQGLMTLYRMNGDWTSTLRVGQRYLALEPADTTTALRVVEAAFRANDRNQARLISLRLLKPDAPPTLVEQTLILWREFWPGAEPLALARQSAAVAGVSQRVAYAHYLNQSGDPRNAATLVEHEAKSSPSPANVDSRAVYLEALGRLGQRETARAGLEQILLKDSDNDIALSALTPLLLDMGDKGQALNVARKLVTVAPTAVAPRLALARSFDAAGDPAAALRTLWEAFHEVPAEERIYSALRAKLALNPDGARRLDEEFADQRKRKLMQDSLL